MWSQRGRHFTVSVRGRVDDVPTLRHSKCFDGRTTGHEVITTTHHPLLNQFTCWQSKSYGSVDESVERWPGTQSSVSLPLQRGEGPVSDVDPFRPSDSCLLRPGKVHKTLTQRERLYTRCRTHRRPVQNTMQFPKPTKKTGEQRVLLLLFRKEKSLRVVWSFRNFSTLRLWRRKLGVPSASTT